MKVVHHKDPFVVLDVTGSYIYVKSVKFDLFTGRMRIGSPDIISLIHDIHVMDEDKPSAVVYIPYYFLN